MIVHQVSHDVAYGHFTRVCRLANRRATRTVTRGCFPGIVLQQLHIPPREFHLVQRSGHIGPEDFDARHLRADTRNVGILPHRLELGLLFGKPFSEKLLGEP